VHGAVFDVGAGILDAAFFSGELPELGFIFVPVPPLGVREVANVCTGCYSVGVVDCDEAASRFCCFFDLPLGETGSTTDANNDAAIPGLFDDAESVEGPAGTAAKDFFSVAPTGLISLGPMLTSSTPPASINSLARDGVIQTIDPPAPSAMMQRGLMRTCVILASMEMLQKNPGTPG
jgi:hypothetical protein